MEQKRHCGMLIMGILGATSVIQHWVFFPSYFLPFPYLLGGSEAKDQDTKRTPSLVPQCLPGLVPQDRGSHSTFTVSERDVHLPSPVVELIPLKMAHPYKYAGNSVDLQGLNVFKGRISVADTGSEMIYLIVSTLLPCT
ncbi:uncharacterized protein LOC131329635 [Rhododendron vialii]|uniref:uncharacterized protein LOC131329635 n=1 Tax=Rhododendron vialii TaxID=182163 RepID=UPI00265FEBF1|nr:uncharacterized protein LOC131329635 [Rhododendron vialii]